MSQQGHWFDGAVAIGRQVSVSASASGLDIATADGRIVAVAAANLIRLSSTAGKVKLGHRAIEGWRLDLDEPIDPALRGVLPRRGFTGAANAGPKTMIAAIALTAVATIVLGSLIVAPGVFARHMPMAWEERIGRLYELPVGTVACADPAAAQALNSLVDRLDPKARQDGLKVQLVDVADANAAALPGRRIIVFNGLLDDARTPEALAGILAHEIAHVRRRHVATAMVRELGLGTVLTLLGGGTVASSGSNLLSLNFTRAAEAEADGDAIDMLRRARIDPTGTSAAFERFRSREMDLPAWANSHPPSAERGARFAASADPKARYRPAMGKAAAKSLFSACRVD